MYLKNPHDKFQLLQPLDQSFGNSLTCKKLKGFCQWLTYTVSFISKNLNPVSYKKTKILHS